VDFSNPQSWNRYSYALNNPLNFMDPSGLCSQNQDGTYSDNGGEPCVTPGDTSVTVSADPDYVPYDSSTDPGGSYFTFFVGSFYFPTVGATSGSAGGGQPTRPMHRGGPTGGCRIRRGNR
jgi:hypothetical protein